MKATFNITKLWHSKPKANNQKTKTSKASYKKQDSWDMSPEDALRVSYSGYK